MNNNLGDFISRGSEGDVYLLEKNKIIKFLKKDKINYLEFYILKHLKHNNISKALQIEIGKNNIKIVQEKADYDLSDWIRKKSVKKYKKEKMSYIIQLVSAVYYLNSFNIIHGDIKPQNILLYNNKLKLNDFGFSKICQKKINHNKKKFYTLNYRPPECNFNKQYLKSDVWALGCTIYEIYYAKSYFKIDNNNNLYHLTLPEEKGNDFINNIVQKMLKTDLKERYSIDQVSEYFNISLIPKKTLTVKNNLEIMEELDYNFYKIEN